MGKGFQEFVAMATEQPHFQHAPSSWASLGRCVWRLRTLLRHVVACGALWVMVSACASLPSPSSTPVRTAPRPGYTLLDEQTVDRFVVQRWASPDSPRDSPSGVCECIVLVFDDGRQVLDLGETSGTLRVEPLKDLTGDGVPEVVMTSYSGGAHCCESTTVYAISGGTARTLLSVATGNCQGEMVDLNGDGLPEFRTCDDRFAYEFCAFAFSPLPPVVFAFDRARQEFVLSTPAFAGALEPPTDDDVRAHVADAGSDAELLACAALQPALHAIYTGRLDEGRALLRRWYPRDDEPAIEQRMLLFADQSPLRVR